MTAAAIEAEVDVATELLDELAADIDVACEAPAHREISDQPAAHWIRTVHCPDCRAVNVWAACRPCMAATVAIVDRLQVSHAPMVCGTCSRGFCAYKVLITVTPIRCGP